MIDHAWTRAEEADHGADFEGALGGGCAGDELSLGAEEDLDAEGVSRVSAFSQARMLQSNGGIANSSTNKRWGFMVIGLRWRRFRNETETSLPPS